LPSVLYGHETWSHTVKEEHKLRTLQNGVLRKIIGLRKMMWWESGENC